MKLTIRNAADKEKDIRALRPESGDGKSIIEEAHEPDQYVAEAEGFGGRAGNVEEVREQVLDAINRIPSGFAYQGNTTAAIILDFTKTAEVLESHGLDDEAAQLDAIAARMVQYAEAIGLKKKADLFDDVAEKEYNLPLQPPADAPPAATPPPGSSAGPTVQPKSTAPDPAPAGAKKPAPAAVPAAEPAPQPAKPPSGAGPHDPHPPKVSDPPRPATRSGGGKLFGRIMTFIGAASTIGSVVDGNVAGGLANAAMTGGAMMLTGENLAKLKDLFIRNPRAAAGVTVAAVAGLIAANTLASSLKTTFDADVQDAIAELESFADDTSYPESFRRNLLSAVAKLREARSIYGSVIAESAQLGEGTAGKLMTLLDGAASDVDKAKRIGEESSVFRSYVGFPKMDSLMKDLKSHSEKIVRDALGSSKITVDELRAQVGNAAAPGGATANKLPSDPAAEQSRISGLQREFGLPVTGKPDQALMRELGGISDMWVAYEPSLAKVLTSTYLLENATDKTIQQLDELWRRRELISQ